MHGDARLRIVELDSQRDAIIIHNGTWRWRLRDAVLERNDISLKTQRFRCLADLDKGHMLVEGVFQSGLNAVCTEGVLEQLVGPLEHKRGGKGSRVLVVFGMKAATAPGVDSNNGARPEFRGGLIG